jgi:hypothetical protein
MEDTFFNKIPGLEKLLETRSFSELTGSEKEEVLRYMSQQMYDAYHEVILESKSHFSHEQKSFVPDPAIHKRLMERMESRRSPGNGVADLLQKLFTFRIPLYQPAFALAVLAVLFFIIPDRKYETIRYLARTDTIYLEKAIPTVHRQENQSVPKVNTLSAGKRKTKKPSHSHHDHYVENAYQKIQLGSLFKRGSSASDDSASMKFLVAAY